MAPRSWNMWKGDVPVVAIYGATTATKTYQIITDALNTPRRLMDPATNAVVWSWDSTAFGVAPPSVETVKFHLRFPGQVYDDLTKQHYNLNRYYNPELGRYMEADPIGLEGGLNPYAYVGSNPVNAVDPRGLDFSPLTDFQMSNVSFERSINIIPRDSWSDFTPNYSNMTLNNGGYNKITLHHTGSRTTPQAVEQLHTQNGSGLEQMIRNTLGGIVPGVQSYNYTDVGYHFLVASTGDIFTGRSLSYQGAHVYGHNANNIGVAFLGDFSSQPLSQAQYRSGSSLVSSLAIRYGIISSGIQTHGYYDSKKHDELAGAMSQVNQMKMNVACYWVTGMC